MNVIEDPIPSTLRHQDALSPKHRGDFFRAVADFQTELFRVEAGFIPAIKRWKLKHEMAELVFRDARRVQDLRTRCRELGANFSGQHASKTVRGAALIERLCHAADGESAFHAIFSLIKPALRELLKDALHHDLLIFDAPSTSVIQDNVSELERQLSWSADQPEYEPIEPSDWLEEVRRLTKELRDELESVRKLKAEPERKGRKMGALPILRSAIPEGFREIEAGTPRTMGSAYADNAFYYAQNFLMEIQAAESCASLLFEAPDMPWDFYFDLARHMWDETRHCQFGELKLAALGYQAAEVGVSHTAYVLRQTIDPLDRYTALTTQEADAFPGKHAGLKEAIRNGDEILARAWSYDIADETQHVRYGHKWIPVMIEVTGESRNYEQLKRDAENWRRDVLGAVYTPTARFFSDEKS